MPDNGPITGQLVKDTAGDQSAKLLRQAEEIPAGPGGALVLPGERPGYPEASS